MTINDFKSHELRTSSDQPAPAQAANWAYSLGFWSASITTLGGAIYFLVILGTILSGRFVFPPSQTLQLFGGISSLLFCPALVILAACLHTITPAEKKVFSQITLGFTLLFALAVSINRYSQLGVVRQSVTSRTVQGVDWFLPYGDHSIMLGLEYMGWGWFLGLALLFAAPLFSNGKLQLWLHRSLILYGALGLTAAVAFLLASPLSLLGFVAWGFVLFVVTALLAVYFRQAQQTSQAIYQAAQQLHSLRPASMPWRAARRHKGKEGSMDRKLNFPFWLRWVGANSVAEVIGLGATLTIDFVIVSRIAAVQSVLASVVATLLVTASGAIEGVVVGLLQWSVLRRPFPLIARRAWVIATVIGAVIAWFFGALPSTLMDMGGQQNEAAPPEPETATVLLLAAAMGLFLGFVLGYPQWRVLRRAVNSAWLWIPANCVAWALGMPAVFAAIDLAQRSTSLAGAVLTLAVGLFLTGAVVGAVHGLVLVWLASPSRPQQLILSGYGQITTDHK